MLQYGRGEPMKTTLKDLLEREIFESYDILSATERLDHSFESVSILETPDFENYIIERMPGMPVSISLNNHQAAILWCSPPS